MTDAAAHAVECVVIGAGVVGLAVARALALQGREVLLVEACDAIGTQTSARNSEVIHAGIYYPKGSLKAQLCVQGKELLYAYCQERAIAHRQCGKLIVATAADQLPALQTLRTQALTNGVGDLEMLSAAEARALEPAVHCVGALYSPSTGIIDSHALMMSLLADLEAAGGTLALNSPLARIRCAQGAIELEAVDGTRLQARCVVNAAGLEAVDLAHRTQGLDARHIPQAFFAKGQYFSVPQRSPFSRLIYPIPVPGGLGIHLTLDLAGQARFGPDVQWVKDRTDYGVDPKHADGFAKEIRRYWPDLPEGALQPAYAGMRPKIAGPADPAADFCVQGPATHGVPGLVNLFGIESPGLTSCLALGARVAQMLV